MYIKSDRTKAFDILEAVEQYVDPHDLLSYILGNHEVMVDFVEGELDSGFLDLVPVD
jgi:hypothetical protein